MNTKAYFGEALGTFLLTLAVSGSLVVGFGVTTPIVAALTLGLCVYTLGGVSGAHLNPAISVMLFFQKKVSVIDTIGYIVAQLLGAFLAAGLTMKLYGSAPEVIVVNNSLVLLAEGLGAFCLGLGVSAVANEKVSKGACGLTVGGSLLLGILLAFKVSNGVLNPAVAFGIGSMGWAYIGGPLIGVLIAGSFYQGLITTKKQKKKTKKA